PANAWMRAVPVPAGDAEVVFEFHSTYLLPGAALSLLATAAVALAAARRRPRSVDGGGPRDTAPVAHPGVRRLAGRRDPRRDRLPQRGGLPLPVPRAGPAGPARLVGLDGRRPVLRALGLPDHVAPAARGARERAHAPRPDLRRRTLLRPPDLPDLA